MKSFRSVLAWWLSWLIVGSMAAGEAADGPAGAAGSRAWRGVHLMCPSAAQLPVVERAIVERLAPLGVNVLVLEVDYRFRWRSHPELASTEAIGHAEAHALARLCRDHGIRLIPLFNCLGHQSWAKTTLPLLARHPELDETPKIPRDNPGIYCRSWCPRNPKVNRIVFALMDELLDAFEADALHVGMDEVFLIASDQCPRCRGQDPARLFARAVRDYHRHLVDRRKVTMLMWGDRLLDDKVMHYGRWESSTNGTAAAIARLPKDIVICDWHYEVRESYPSVPYFQAQGFRVWPSSWRNERAALALLDYSRQHATGRMLGQLCTTWTEAAPLARALLGEQEPSLHGVADLARTTEVCLRHLAGAAQAPR